jgi:phage anti-repressor protein
MNELIKVTETNGRKAVSARELHEFLGNKRQFADWIKQRINKYGLIDGIDYTRVSLISERGMSIEYVLTLEASKELAMVEGNEKGKQARQYFIDCEKQLAEKQTILSEVQLLLMAMQQMTAINANVNEQKQELTEIKQQVKALEASREIKQDYYSILAFTRLKRIEISYSEAIQKGKLAAKLTKEKGLDLRKIADERYGYVGSYPIEILEVVFDL